MVGAQVLVDALATLLAANAATLAPAMDPVEIALVSNNFVESPSRVIGDFTIASGNGLDAIVGVAGAQQVGKDPSTGMGVITIKEPAGGFHWQLTGTLTDPLTIYGFILTTTAAGALLACALLEAPITVQTTGDIIDIGNATLRLPTQPLT